MHLPVTPRVVALPFGGAAGYSFLHRGPHEEFFGTQSLSSGLYCSFSAGIRFISLAKTGCGWNTRTLPIAARVDSRLKAIAFS